MPDVDRRRVAATPLSGGQPELHRIETTERFIDRLDGPRVWRSATRPGPAGSTSTGC
jgi:hypothetical protein